MGKVEIRWRKSSYSGGNGGECVQVAAPGGDSAVGAAGLLLVRDSKDAGGPVLAFTARQWRAFTAGLRAGRP
jgi:hypothetical protein